MTAIKEYLLIGDLHTAALVSGRGAIDWLCLPAFDSSSIFAAVLDPKKGGTFRIHDDGYETSCRYLPNTAIVETEFKARRNTFHVRDFMVPRPTEEAVAHYLVRKVTGIRGESRVVFHLDARPRYAKQTVTFKRRGEKLFVARLSERSLWLHIPRGAIIRRRNGGTILEISMRLKEGETKEIVLEYSFESRLRYQGRDLEADTALFWREWVGQGKFFDFCRNELIRSAITLKLMQFYPTGGLIAAPTTSLPETIGGERNWDYRYVWLRDASFTLYAFYVLGFKEEAKRFFRFIEEVAEEFSACDDEHCSIDVSVMYTIWGQKLQREESLNHLSGYQKSRPVRVGNGASTQRQLDIYGSVIDSYYFMWKVGLPISKRGKDVVRLLVRKIEEQWQAPDSGIWEVRGFTAQFTYGKVMAWVGVDRAIRLAEELGISARKKKEWEKLKATMERWIWKNCFNKKQGTFTQYPGVQHQDATNFLFVLLHFLDRHEERTKKVIRETRKELAYRDLFVYRYKAKDGLTGEEGGFILCMFWMIAALAATGELKEAKSLFRRFEKLIPMHGLMAEEIDPVRGDFLGNHPQAFSHIGYIMGAYYIHKYTEREKGHDVGLMSGRRKKKLVGGKKGITKKKKIAAKKGTTKTTSTRAANKRTTRRR